MKKICVYLAEGFEEIEAITIIDLLRRGGVQVQAVSIEENLLVKGGHGISVMADVNIKNSGQEIDGHILPGGMPGTENLFDSDILREIFIEANRQNKLLGAICAAPSVLGRWGLLKGKDATCYPGFEKYLVGANVLEDIVVIDKNIYTSRGPGTATDFGLALIEALIGKEKKEEVQAGLLYKS